MKYGKRRERKATSNIKDKNDTSFNRELCLHGVEVQITNYPTDPNQLANSNQSR